MPRRLLWIGPCLLLLFCFAAPEARAGVRVVGDAESGYQLRVDGEPFFIKGGGGDGPKDLLAASGGNAFRTWGVGDDTPARLERAREHGLKVALGFWLGHERHGFDYGDAAALAEQKEMVRRGVLKYRDDPAVLLWSIGNEMEGFAAGDDPRIWSHVQELAAMVKRLDPTRPTMTAVSEIGGKRVEAIHEMCPDIDIVGINSYAGGPSIPTRYREAGGTKPYVLTEFGPPGTWETEKNAFGAAPELTSTQKGEVYARVWNRAIEAERDGLCLGGFAFTWGWKQEATATWFGMFLPDGSKLAAVDEMTLAWTGSYPENRCPAVEPLTVTPAQSVEAGERVKVELAASDPEGDSLEVEWRLRAEADRYQTGGDPEDPTADFPDAILYADHETAVIELPEPAGVYRVYAFVRDGRGGAAVANLPLEARPAKDEADDPADGRAPVLSAAAAAGKPVELPFTLYGDAAEPSPWAASGYMGHIDAIAMNLRDRTDPSHGETAIRAAYTAPDRWGGVVWQDPADDWGDAAGGYDLRGATRLTFHARGQRGGEAVNVGFGVLGPDADHPDSGGKETGITLTRDWKRYEIDLTGVDLRRIKTGFFWSVAGAGEPIVFYLDEIVYR